MTQTDPNVFMFEYWLEVAIASQLTAYGIIDPARQRNEANLKTPRVEVKTIWNGFNGHRFTTPAGASWFDQGHGKLAMKIVTRRNDPTQTHTQLVGLVRWMMATAVFGTAGYTPGNPDPITITDRMPFHKIAQLTDTGAVPQFVADEHQDVSALSFDFILQIRTEKFPQ